METHPPVLAATRTLRFGGHWKFVWVGWPSGRTFVTAYPGDSKNDQRKQDALRSAPCGDVPDRSERPKRTAVPAAATPRTSIASRPLF